MHSLCSCDEDLIKQKVKIIDFQTICDSIYYGPRVPGKDDCMICMMQNSGLIFRKANIRYQHNIYRISSNTHPYTF